MFFKKKHEKPVIDAEMFEAFFKHWDDDRDRLEDMYRYLSGKPLVMAEGCLQKWDATITNLKVGNN